MGRNERIQTDHLPQSPAVYRVVCDPTGECYVGSSAKLRMRAVNHAVQLAYGDHYSRSMQQAYDQHGAAAFRVEILDECDLSELSPRETAWIERLKPAFNQHQRAGVIRPLGKGRPPRYRRTKVTPTDVPTELAQPAIAKENRLSHPARRQRRQEMADAVAAGEGAAEVAVRFGVTGQTVTAAVREYGISPVTIKKHARQRKIRGVYEPGMTIGQISKATGISAGAVWIACKEIGIQLRRGRPKGSIGKGHSTYVPRQIWESVDWTKQNTEIARELLVTPERVRQVRKMLGKEKSPRHWQRTEPARRRQTQEADLIDAAGE